MAHHARELIPTRATLLERLKNWQDRTGWQDFFDTYWPLIYGFARKAGLADAEAQDVVQETMIAAARHLPTFKYDPAIGSFKAWLLTMTRWRILDQVKKRGPVSAGASPAAGTASGTQPMDKVVDPATGQLDQIWEREWQQAIFDAALAKVRRRVDPVQFQLFDFYVNKDWPPAKVATRFGVKVDQVYLAKHRVTAILKREVQRLEAEVT